MTTNVVAPVLLALDAGVRETGWAVFKDGEVAASGVTGLSTRRKLEPEVRVSHLIESLDELAFQWMPQAVALCQPSGINWPVPALDLLLLSLAQWSEESELPQFSYTAQEVRTAIAGHPNASRDELGYATMFAVGAHRARAFHPRMGSHRRGPLPPYPHHPEHPRTDARTDPVLAALRVLMSADRIQVVLRIDEGLLASRDCHRKPVLGWGNGATPIGIVGTIGIVGVVEIH